MCLPAENMELSRFGGDDQRPPLAPGPLLAGAAYAVAGSDGAGLAGVSEDFLFAVISGGRRMASWATWLEFSAMRELALRHPAVPARPARKTPPATPEPAAGQERPGPAEPGAAEPGAAAAAAAGDGRVQFAEFVADEVAADLRMTWMTAADRISYAVTLATRLPVTFAAMGAGLIDPVHAKIIYEQTDILSAADAARAGPVLAAAAQHKTYGELRAAAARLVLRLDPGAAERHKQKRRKQDAHVRPFREESGNAGMTARELPADEVLASWQHVQQRALDLRAAGISGTLRDLLAAAARSPRTRWCVTLLHSDGTAAHGCAPGRHPAPPGPAPPGPGSHASPGTASPGTTRDASGEPGQRPPAGTRARDYLRSLGVRLTPVARGSCDHRHAEAGYRPSRKLRHLVTARSARCCAPGCSRPAARCDLDHTIAWDAGGITCECDLAPPCKR